MAALLATPEKLVKIGARIVRHGRYVVVQLAGVAVPRTLFGEVLRQIDQLRPKLPLAAMGTESKDSSRSGEVRP